MTKSIEMEIIVNKIRNCTRCALNLGRKNVVPGEGSLDSPLIFVGEGPGAEEDATGRPFVGKAGRLLEEMLTEIAKLKREQVYITNVVKCRPPKNRTPTDDEMKKCSHFLIAQIMVIRPKIIVTLGGTALKYFLGKDVGITKARGKFYNWYGGLKIFATFHPSYLLRNPSESVNSPKFLAKIDMKAIGYMYRILKEKPNMNLDVLESDVKRKIEESLKKIGG